MTSGEVSSGTATIAAITHKRTNAYLVGGRNSRNATGGNGSQGGDHQGGGYVLFDALWPDSFPALSAGLKSNGVKLADVRYLVVSHFHMDHAGLTQALKDYGVTLLLHERQAAAPQALNEFFIRKPDKAYKPIASDGNLVASTAESRRLLAEIGIDSEIIPTPGHSEDSVSLVLDDGAAFIGDLPPYEYAEGHGAAVIKSWSRLIERGVKTAYHAHAGMITLPSAPSEP